MLITRTCELCSTDFEATRANARYCSPAHRNKAYRQRQDAKAAAAAKAESGETPDSPPDARGFGVQQALESELHTAGADGTTMGKALMAVARRIDYPVGETGSSLASLVLRLGIELERTLGKAVAAGHAPAEDEVAKARDKRDRKRGSR